MNVADKLPALFGWAGRHVAARDVLQVEYLAGAVPLASPGEQLHQHLLQGDKQLHQQYFLRPHC